MWCHLTVWKINEKRTQVCFSFNVSFLQTYVHSSIITGVVHICNNDEDIVQDFIRLAYTGKLTVDRNNVESVFIAADYFQSYDLKHFCEEFFFEQLDGTNALNFRKFGECFHLVKLVKSTDKVISSNFLDVASSVDLPLLEIEQFAILVSWSDLEVNFEEDIFNAIKRWLSHDYQRRSKYIDYLLQYVRLAIIKSRYLASAIAKFPPYMASNDCKLLIDNIAAYLSNLKLDDFNPKKVKPRGFLKGRFELLIAILLIHLLKVDTRLFKLSILSNFHQVDLLFWMEIFI